MSVLRPALEVKLMNSSPGGSSEMPGKFIFIVSKVLPASSNTQTLLPNLPSGSSKQYVPFVSISLAPSGMSTQLPKSFPERTEAGQNVVAEENAVGI